MLKLWCVDVVISSTANQFCSQPLISLLILLAEPNRTGRHRSRWVYARLTDIGQPPAWFQEDVTSRMPNQEEREQLGLPTGNPVLVIRRTVRGPTGRALEVNVMTADAGSYVLRYRWAAAQPEIEQQSGE